jgi:hypothetical protein
MQTSVREWALRQGWGGRSVRQENAQGILVAAPGMLAKHYGNPLPNHAVQTSGYPKLVAQLLFERAKRSARLSGRKERAIPLFSIRYKDNAPMVTVGIALVDEDMASKLAELAPRMPFPDFLNADVQVEIDVPPLTYKEKVALDQLMPRAALPSEEQLLELVGFKLKPSQIQSYAANYKHYPTFGDLTV